MWKCLRTLIYSTKAVRTNTLLYVTNKRLRAPSNPPPSAFMIIAFNSSLWVTHWHCPPKIVSKMAWFTKPLEGGKKISLRRQIAERALQQAYKSFFNQSNTQSEVTHSDPTLAPLTLSCLWLCSSPCLFSNSFFTPPPSIFHRSRLGSMRCSVFGSTETVTSVWTLGRQHIDVLAAVTALVLHNDKGAKVTDRFNMWVFSALHSRN